MKSKKVLIIIVVAALVLAAAGFGVYKFLIQKSGVQASATQEITPDVKLAVGILKLENTDLAVTPEQATSLLPLWKGISSFGNSDTISDAEMDALYAQIEDNLTADQMAMINSIDLENTDMATIASDLGIGMGMAGQGRTNPNISEDQLATLRAQRSSSGTQDFPRDFPQGDIPQGDFAGGGGNFAGQGGNSGGGNGSGFVPGDGGGFPADAAGGDAMFFGQGTQNNDSSAQTAAAVRIQNPFLNILINLLTQRAAG